MTACAVGVDLVGLMVVTALLASPGGAQEPLEVTSPDDLLRFAVAAGDEGLRYGVTRDGRALLVDSVIGLRIREHANVFAGAAVTASSPVEVEQNWRPPCGPRARITRRHVERTFSLRAADGLQLSLEVRAFDGGVAWCYHVPRQEGLVAITVEREHTTFRFAPAGQAWFAAHAQGAYRRVPLGELPRGAERPLVVELDGGVTVALAEARLVDSARTKFDPAPAAPDAPTGVVTSMAGPATFALPWRSPWRVVLVEDSPARLLERGYESLLALNDHRALADTSWITPGKVLREVTLTDAGARAVVDFCARRGLQYCHIDAGWYGPENDAASDATTCTVDPRRSEGPLDVPAVVRYAAAKGVKVMLYVNRRALERQLDELLPLYRSWGVAGLKFGFVRVGDQDATRWLHEAIRKAGEAGFVVDVHDEYRPTGVERTWPNLLTAEGIRGDEESPPLHQTIAHAFCRNLAGPADNTFCYFDPRVGGAMGNHTAQLAKSVVFYSPLQFLYWYDRPAASPREGDIAKAGAQRVIDESLPELAFWDALPVTWDDSRVLSGAIGEHVTVARRSGEEWFVGVLNANEARTIAVPLAFLDQGRRYVVAAYRHDEQGATATKVCREQREVAGGAVLTFALGADDGVALRIAPKGP